MTTGLESFTHAAGTEALYFYDDEVTLFYDDRLHSYYLVEDGLKVIVPGSTTVGAMIDKSGPLTQWAANTTADWVVQNVQTTPATRDHLAEAFATVRRREILDPFDLPLNITISTFELAKLLNEARFNFRTIQKDAADIGHVAHEWLEGYVKAQIAQTTYPRPFPHEDPDAVKQIGLEGAQKATNCVIAAVEWFKRHKIGFLFSERKVFSREYVYAGTADWFAFVTGCGDPNCCPFQGRHFTCGDFKSSKALHREYFVQLASYQHAWNEEMPTKNPEHVVTQRLLLRIDKEGNGFETIIRPLETFESDFAGFLGALQIYVWDRQLELDERWEKAQAKDELRAQKAADKAEEKQLKAEARAALKLAKQQEKALAKSTKKPRRVVAKSKPPAIATNDIPVEGKDLLPWEGPDRHAPRAIPDLDDIPIEGALIQ